MQIRSSLVRMRSSLVRMWSSLVRMRSSLVRMRSSLVRMRSSLVASASDWQCTCCNGPGFNPSIRRHSGIWWAADEAVLNIVRKKNPPKKYLKKGSHYSQNSVAVEAQNTSRGGPWTLKMEAWRLKMEAWRLKMEPSRVYRPVDADSHHNDESRIRIRISIKVISWIRIRIKGMGIHNSGQVSQFSVSVCQWSHVPLAIHLISSSLNQLINQITSSHGSVSRWAPDWPHSNVMSRVPDPDPHYFWKLDPDPQLGPMRSPGFQIQIHIIFGSWILIRNSGQVSQLSVSGQQMVSHTTGKSPNSIVS